MRLFVGIEFPESIIDSLSSLQNEIRTMIRSGRFPARENLHLTLQFLGETPESRVKDILGALEVVSKNNQPFILSFDDQLRYFGHVNPVRVVWLGMKGELATLLRLQASIVSKTQELGFANDGRAYEPHVTLAREVDFDNSRDLLNNGRINFSVGSFPSIHVGRFSLFSSSVEQGKLVYRTLKTFTLDTDKPGIV